MSKTRRRIRPNGLKREAIAYAHVFSKEHSPAEGSVVSHILWGFFQHVDAKLKLDGSRLGFGFPYEIEALINDGFPYVSAGAQASSGKVADVGGDPVPDERPLRFGNAPALRSDLPPSP